MSTETVPKTYTFEESVERFERSGFMLARLETLMLAGRDKRIDRSCLEVLICLIEALNRETMTTFIGREAIGNKVGISVKSVSNYLSQLRSLGYLTSAYRPTPQANNRCLLHYTLTALSPEELEKVIARAVSSLRGETSSVVAVATSRQDRNSMAVSSRQDGKSPIEFPSGQEQTSRQGRYSKGQSSRQDGRSNTSLTSVGDIPTSVGNMLEAVASPTAQPTSRGTRLPIAWQLPKAWGEWTLSEFPRLSAEQVRQEGERFRDYWVAKAGKDATKLDWGATWRNWCRNSKWAAQKIGSGNRMSLEEMGAVVDATFDRMQQPKPPVAGRITYER